MRDIFDTHVHCLSWEQTADDIVAQMDEFGIRMECVIAPPIWYENRDALNTLPRRERRTAFSRIWREKAPAANDLVAGWARERPERILGLAWIDPLHPEAARVIRETDYIFRKLKVPEEIRRKIYWENAAAFWRV